MACKKNRPSLALAPLALVIAGLFHMQPVFAQQTSPRATTAERDVGRELARSERRVRLLQQRVERLESQLEALAQAQQQMASMAAASSGTPAQAAARQVRPGVAAQGSAGATPPRTASQVAQAGSTSSSGAGAAGTRRSGPGSFEVDEDAAQRALERTLTQAGALLLPPGAYTIEPGFSYVRNERSAGTLAQVTDGNGATGLVMVDQNLRRNEYTLRARLKAGLPWDAQLEAEVPFEYVSARRGDGFGNETSGTGSAWGDIEIGLAKTLLRERGMLPDLIARLSFNSGSGKRNDGNVGLQGGYRSVTGELVALKRQDPLAFFAAASYGAYREEDGIKPGALGNLSIGTVLAASPSTSLQFGFNQTRRLRQEVAGVKIPGSEQTYGTFSIGASSVLSRDVMLITSLGLGLGSDAPDYSLNVSLPITFR